MTPQRLFDELLVLHAKTGRLAAADRLAARWQPRFLRTARRVLGDTGLAEEAAQETWLAISARLHTLRDPKAFPAWAFSILHRRCADCLRRTIRDRGIFSGTETVPDVAIDGGAEARLSINAAFARLSDEHRIAAVLFFGEGLTLAEIAVATDVPLGTAKSRLFHARKQLRAELQETAHD
ncbi:MAG: sigma-70 family RNA polymerase sigma factor [Pseudomonadota bacterium]